MPSLRRAGVGSIVAVLGCAFAIGCGGHEPAGSGVPAIDSREPTVPAEAAPASPPTPRGEREVVSKEAEALQRELTLVPLDVPLAVGARAPRFDGYPEKSRAVVVFFRGEW